MYAFSSENWSRPKPAVDAINKLVIKAIDEQVPDLIKQKVKLNFFGNLHDFGEKILSKIKDAENTTSNQKSVLDLNVALGYGGRQDIVNISKEIAQKVISKNITIDQIDEDLIAEISSCPISEIDLLIRTGGDRRISNFLLYQIAYTEINFVDKYWPDFQREDCIECLENFKKVSRRFGKRI